MWLKPSQYHTVPQPIRQRAQRALQQIYVHPLSQRRLRQSLSEAELILEDYFDV